MTGHVKPELGAYVLGALEPGEAEAVRRHLEDCADCAAEHRALAALPTLLGAAGGAHAATVEPLPAAFEERLLDAYASERAGDAPRRRRDEVPRRRRSDRSRWRAWRGGVPRWIVGGVAAAALAAVLAVVLVGGDDAPAPPYEVTLQGVGIAADASARAALEPLPEGTELHLWVENLPTGAPAVYEVLCEAPGWQASAGTFRVDASGRAYVVLTTAARRGEYDAIRVVRRARGADGDIRTSEVLEARL